MKTKLVQFLNQIDRRHLQLAYFILMLAAGVILRGPSDGGTGPF